MAAAKSHDRTAAHGHPAPIRSTIRQRIRPRRGTNQVARAHRLPSAEFSTALPFVVGATPASGVIDAVSLTLRRRWFGGRRTRRLTRLVAIP